MCPIALDLFGKRGNHYTAPPSLLCFHPAIPPSCPAPPSPNPPVGRTDRLPRERAPLATLAPPLSPSKAGTPKDTSRLQFTSILSGN